MTLRARLAAGFFVVLLGPALLGTALLATVLLAPAPGLRFEQAGTAVELAVTARCRHLDVTAQGLAATAAARAESLAVTPDAVPGSWGLCGVDPSPVGLSAGTRYGGLAARAEIRDGRDGLGGYAYAVQPLDDSFLRELSAAAGVRVIVAGPAGGDDGGGQPGPYARLEQSANQPLPLALSRASVANGDPSPVVIAVGLVAGLVAGLMGWWLAGVATRPLVTLLDAVDQVTAGDLAARPRVFGRDEAGRLGRGLHRLIAGMQETQRLAVTDALTGLGNLRHLGDSLRVEIERASRFGRALGVLVLDLDHFKAVNDRCGHRGGDEVLVEFAFRVRGVVREVDLAFRQGGEEFVILLPETEVAGSMTVARRIGEAVRDQPFRVGGRRGGGATIEPDLLMPVTVSIGVAVFPRHAITGAEVLDAADDALYAAKAAGRDTYALASAAVPQQRPRVRVEAGGASVGTTSPRTSAGG